jgi:serine protease
MNCRLLGVIVVAAAVLVLAATGVRGAPPADAVTRLVVKFKDGEPAKAMLRPALRVRALAADAGVALTHLRTMALGGEVVGLPTPLSAADAEALAAALAGHADVMYAFPDGWRQPMVRANDEFIGGQGYLENEPGGISAFAAWDVTTGSAANVVAVIDTGFRPHPDMAGRNLPGYDFISDPQVANDGDGRDADAADPGDWISSADKSLPGFADCSVTSSSWHGTAVAGVVAANTNNGQWVAGIDWSARILPLRVLGKCGGYDSDIIDAVAWAGGLAVPGVPANAYPAQVINLSLGGKGACHAGYRAVFSAVRAAGHTRAVVAAAGNESEDVADHSPANCPEVIAVASTTTLGRLSAYSNFGLGIALSAPGGQYRPAVGSQGIIVLSNAGLTTPAGDYFGNVGGTSFAAPMVAGTASLMLAAAPALTSQQLRSILVSTVKPFPAGSNCTTDRCGPGILDANAAVRAAKALAPVDTTTAAVIEYYHAAFGHYFITASAIEIARLDDGTFVGWARTGRAFKVYATPRDGTVPVCRFFTVAFPPKSSHFYTADVAECAKLKTNPDWTFEAEVFHALLPADDGACVAGTIPVYRLYNNGQSGAPNHRYTTDLAVRAQMIAQNYTPEGTGTGVGLCAPQ